MIQWPVPIIEDKYSRWYESLMAKAQARGSVHGYKEGHHIIPNSFIKNKNRVELTAREHYIAHLLLWRMKFPQKWHNKMSMALHVMVNGSGHSKQDRNYLIPSRIYESARHSFVQAMKEHFAEHGGTMKGKKHTPDALEKMRAWQNVPEIKQQQRERVLGEKNHFYGKKHSEEMKTKISASCSASWTKDIKEEKSKAMKEMWKDPEYAKMQADKKKTSEGWLNRDWKAIGRKAADTKMANGWKPSEEAKKKSSETRCAKIASGEIVSWNKGKKVGCFRSKESSKAGAIKAAATRKANGTQASLKGEANGFFGKTHSAEIKAKIAATKAAKKAAGIKKKPSTMTKETQKAAIEKANATKAAKKAAGIKRKTVVWSEETKQAQAEKYRATMEAKKASGWVSPSRGKPKSSETIAKQLATKLAKKLAKSNNFLNLFYIE